MLLLWVILFTESDRRFKTTVLLQNKSKYFIKLVGYTFFFFSLGVVHNVSEFQCAVMNGHDHSLKRAFCFLTQKLRSQTELIFTSLYHMHTERSCLQWKGKIFKSARSDFHLFGLLRTFPPLPPQLLPPTMTWNTAWLRAPKLLQSFTR